jgi:hypothetical protein
MAVPELNPNFEVTEVSFSRVQSSRVPSITNKVANQLEMYPETTKAQTS